MNKLQKNTQLSYIKGQFRWLMILTVVFIMAVGWFFAEACRWKRNYTDLHHRVNQLEYILKNNLEWGNYANATRIERLRSEVQSMQMEVTKSK